MFISFLVEFLTHFVLNTLFSVLTAFWESTKNVMKRTLQLKIIGWLMICVLFKYTTRGQSVDDNPYIHDHGYGTTDIINDCFNSTLFAWTNETDGVANIPIMFSLSTENMDCLSQRPSQEDEWFIMDGLNITSVDKTGNGVITTAHLYATNSSDRRLLGSCTWDVTAKCADLIGLSEFDTRVCQTNGCSSWAKISGRQIIVPPRSSGSITATCARSSLGVYRVLRNPISGESSNDVSIGRSGFGRFSHTWNLQCN